MSDRGIRTTEDTQWLRQYKIHQEELLYSRINIFIVVLSIFVGIFGVAQSYDTVIALAVLTLGVLLTMFWWLAVHRQNVIVTDFRARLKREDPIFAEWAKDRVDADAAQKTRKWISGQLLVVHALPAMFLVFWVFALFWVLKRLLGANLGASLP